MKNGKDPLVSRDVSMRRDQEEKLRNSQQREMNTRQVSRETNAFYQSVDASNDRYMRDALERVRQSDVSFPEDLTRMNGTWMHNQSIKK